MSHGAQKMNGIMQDIGRGTHKLVAARYTFRRLFLAGMTALLANAVGFAVLMVIDIPVIQDLAITASIGVAVLIFTNLVLLPILLSYTGVSPVAAQRSLKAELMEASGTHDKHPFWAFLDLFTQRKWASIAVLAGLAMGAVGLAVSFQLKIGDIDPGAPELRPDSRYNRDNAFMTANYAASSDVYVVMVRTPQYACGQYDTLMAVDALEYELQQLPGVEATSSLAGLAKASNAGLNEGSLKWFEIPRSQDMLNAIITRAPREMFNQNCDLLTVYAYLKDHKADTLTSVVNVVEAFAARHDTDQVRFLNAAGNAGIEAATNIVVKKANVQMLFLVYAAVIVLAFIAFRTWRAVVCAVVPLMITSMLCEALMVWLNIGVKVATLPVIALGVGIGVDYALYIMTVTLVRLREGMSLSEAYYKALTFTGKVVVLTGITLGIAVATWAFSPIKFQADMGTLLAFMFIWNMLGALILLPALAHFLLRPKKTALA
jgi:predicted RND superfamily exporter protein